MLKHNRVNSLSLRLRVVPALKPLGVLCLLFVIVREDLTRILLEMALVCLWHREAFAGGRNLATTETRMPDRRGH